MSQREKRVCDGAACVAMSWAAVLLWGLALVGCSWSSSQDRATAQAALGQHLFADTRLSADGVVSCESCHSPSRAFTDGRPVSIGVHGARGTRNAPSLGDVRLMKTFFWDGREARLEDAVLQPFTNPLEMGLADRSRLLNKINGDAKYHALAKSAFGRDTLDAAQVAAALAAYLRSLPLGQSRYDLHLGSAGQVPLGEDELAGLALFQGKAACADCHRLSETPATFTDNGFHHTGIGFEQVAGNVTEMVRRLDATVRNQRPIGEAILADPEVAELGRFAATRRPADLGAFRTPSLRNLALTAPYMHDGSIATLAQAVEREIYYRSLARGRPISLTVQEQRQLLVFLQALSPPPAR